MENVRKKCIILLILIIGNNKKDLWSIYRNLYIILE